MFSAAGRIPNDLRKTPSTRFFGKLLCLNFSELVIGFDRIFNSSFGADGVGGVILWDRPIQRLGLYEVKIFMQHRCTNDELI